jgi:hypothetical protein
MSTQYPEVPWPDQRFEENQSRFPVEELWKYAGQHVAWSMDGTRLLAGAVSLNDLIRQLHEAGIDPQRVVFDYVDPPDKGFLG